MPCDSPMFYKFMSKPLRITPVAGLLMLSAVSACSTIKQWFPDKEKDYQYTTEIPELVLPPDLKNGLSLSLPVVAPTAAAPIETPDQKVQPPADAAPRQDQADNIAVAEPSAADSSAFETETSAPEPAVETTSPDNPASEQPGAKPTPLPVERMKSQNQDSLRIHAPFNVAWRAVDKALSRKSIEVNNRDMAEKQFAVRYDPNEMQIQDGSFWDELDFMVFGLQGHEKAYLIKITDGGQRNDVTILDPDGQPATGAGAVGLLKLLEDTIKSDFPR